MLKSTLQDPRNLLLGVIHTEDLPLSLRVLDARVIVVGDWSVTFRIIGESHWITIRVAGQKVLHEVLACVPVGTTAWIFQHPFTDRCSCDYSSGPYSVTVDFAPLSLDIAARGTDGECLQVDFPHPEGGASLPFTRIWWRVAEDAITWWTTHVYPEAHQTTAVLSRSCYRLC
jgi:hypothetical protein